MNSQPHLGISARLDHYCDEATFVDWEQDSPDLPGWQTTWRHLTTDGKAAELTHPSAANQTLDFPTSRATSQRLLKQVVNPQNGWPRRAAESRVLFGH